jgi:hypothetical protein
MLVASGCGSALTVRGEVTRPARVPVRAFARIVVVSADNPESVDLAHAVARHLASGRSNVERADDERVRSMREQGLLEVASVVVELRTTLIRRNHSEWGQHDELDCGPGGCFESRRNTIHDVPVLDGHVLVTVTDGPSGRELQQVELTDEETGEDLIGIRLRVLDRLSERALALFDQRTMEVPVALFPIGHPSVQRAIARVGQGRWSEGRLLLERLVASGEFDSLAAGQRALVLYDLGQTKRFDASIPASRRFAEAERALQAAVRLSPQPFFARALDDLDEHRRSRAMVHEQDEARAYNFALFRAQQSGTPPPNLYSD